MACGVLTVGGTDYIYCVGGSAAGQTTATALVFIYDPIADIITQLSNLDNWPGDANGTTLPGGFAVVNNKLYILGGFNINVASTNQIWQFDPTALPGAKWTQMVNTPEGIMYAPTCAIGGIIYVGGASDFSGGLVIDTTNSFSFNPGTNMIGAIAAIPRATGETRGLNVNNQLWVMGGGRVAPNPSNEVDIYDPGTNTWSTGTPFVTARRNFPTDTDGSCRIWLAGGYAPATPTDSMEIFCCGGGTPTPTPTASPSATATATATAPATATPTATATATPTVTATPTATPTCTPGDVILKGSIDDTEPTHNSVNGALSSCAVSPPCPGELIGTFHYDAYQLTNPSGSPVCITVTLSDPTCIYSEVYLGSFDPNNSCTNYLADSNLNASYSVTVPGNATIWVVVEEFTENLGCPSYTVTVSGLGSCPSPTPTATPTCAPGETILNGGFETGDFTDWMIDGNSPTPVISSANQHSGTYSAFAGGNPPGAFCGNGTEPTGDSSFYQQFTVPAGGGTLSFWYWTCTTDSITFDWQDTYITDTSGTILQTIFHQCTNNLDWVQQTVDMAPYAGQTVRIKFLVHQDGFGDFTGMYVDDVSLPGQCGGTPTPTATATATATATPTATATATFTPTPTPTATHTPTPTATATFTPTPTATATATATFTPTPTPTATATATATQPPPTPTVTPTVPPRPSPTPRPRPTPAPRP